MSDIGGIQLTGLNPQPPSEIKLRGIVWSQKAVRVDEQVTTTAMPNVKDNSTVNKVTTGKVPATNTQIFDSNDLPSLDTPVEDKKPKLGTAKNEGLATGIGVVVGAAGGAIASRYVKVIGPKMGALIGLTIGGFIGSRFEKK